MGIFPQPFIKKIVPAAELQIAQQQRQIDGVMKLANSSLTLTPHNQEKD